MKVSIDLQKENNEKLYNYALANARAIKNIKDNYTANMLRIIEMEKVGFFNVILKFKTAFKENAVIHENKSLYTANITLAHFDTEDNYSAGFKYTGRELIRKISFELSSDEMYEIGILNLNKLASICEKGYSSEYDKFIVFANPSGLNPWMLVEGPAKIVAFGTAHIKTGNDSRAEITLFENSSCDSWGHDVITAYDNSSVDNMGMAQYIIAEDNAKLTLRGPVYAHVSGNATYEIINGKECAFVNGYMTI